MPPLPSSSFLSSNSWFAILFPHRLVNRVEYFNSSIVCARFFLFCIYFAVVAVVVVIENNLIRQLNMNMRILRMYVSKELNASLLLRRQLKAFFLRMRRHQKKIIEKIQKNEQKYQFLWIWFFCTIWVTMKQLFDSSMYINSHHFLPGSKKKRANYS